MSKGSLGDSILFGYTQTHSVRFPNLNKHPQSLQCTNSYSWDTARPGADGTERKRKDVCLLFLRPLLDCVSCTSFRVKATRQDQESKSNILDVS